MSKRIGQVVTDNFGPLDVVTFQGPAHVPCIQLQGPNGYVQIESASLDDLIAMLRIAREHPDGLSTERATSGRGKPPEEVCGAPENGLCRWDVPCPSHRAVCLHANAEPIDIEPFSHTIMRCRGCGAEFNAPGSVP